jgi:palmitoyltransferase
MAEKAKPQQQQRFAFSFPVTVVVSSIVYIYISTIFVFIDRWFGLFSSPGIANAVVFTAIASMCIFSYRTAISTDPGRVPSTYTPDIEDNQTPIHEIKRKVTTTLQNCPKKNNFFDDLVVIID